MAVCSRCQKQVGILGVFSYSKATGRCAACQGQVKQVKHGLREQLRRWMEEGPLRKEQYDALQARAYQQRVPWGEFLAFALPVSLSYLERTLAWIASDGVITEAEERHFRTLVDALGVPPDRARALVDRLEREIILSDIRQGEVPVLDSCLLLESNEICHLETDAVYRKVNKSSERLIDGSIAATNKKIHFTSPEGGWSILWKNLMRVDKDGEGVYLELSVKRGNGWYHVDDPIMTQAVLETVAKLHNREIVVKQADSRHVPQHVKTTVWQRDGGKCVQCGSTSYLEFDHIIPYHAGGATSVENLQILCRGCNLKKGGKI